MIKKIGFTVGLVAMAGGLVANEIPSVPLSVVSTGGERQSVRPVEDRQASNNNTTPTGQQGGSAATRSNDADEFTVESGRTQIVRISRDHLNRLVTPFEQPTVDMVDQNSTVQIQDNVVLFATNSDAPVSLYLREHGSQEMAINLVLYPQSIPPKEMRFKLGQSYQMMEGTMARPTARRWERSNPYTSTLNSLFTHIAKGEVPDGYRVLDTIRQTSAYIPSCEQQDMRFEFINGQMIEGHNLSVMIGVAQNIADYTQEFNESVCDNWNVAAVAAWPNVNLKPGESTEVYVAIRNNREAPIRVRRPNLLSRPAMDEEGQ